MGRQIHFDYGFCFLAAALLLTIPLRWILACALAAAVHEGGHYMAVRLLGGEVTQVDFSHRGAKMYASPLPPARELICLLAGPAASFSLLLLAGAFPRLSFCGVVQGLYNLLPIGTSDGARALQCLRTLFSGGREKFLAKRENK